MRGHIPCLRCAWEVEHITALVCINYNVVNFLESIWVGGGGGTFPFRAEICPGFPPLSDKALMCMGRDRAEELVGYHWKSWPILFY